MDTHTQWKLAVVFRTAIVRSMYKMKCEFDKRKAMFYCPECGQNYCKSCADFFDRECDCVEPIRLEGIYKDDY